MEDPTQHASVEPTATNDHDTHASNPAPAILFTTFGTGKSYIFHVDKDVRHHKENEAHSKAKEDEPNPVLKCWEEVFEGQNGRQGSWNFKLLKDYYKPLGETATLTLSPATCTETSELATACKVELLAELEKIEAVFFTTGVAVLVVRIRPHEPADILKYALTNDDKLEGVNKWTKKIIELCRTQYLQIMEAAKNRKVEPTGAKPKWFLNHFKEVDREGWEPQEELSYPLFFVDNNTYAKRIKKILNQVAGSEAQIERQSDKAKVSYQGAEIYVDWSEALVSKAGKNQELIENNFIIALASWYALVLMNKNSSMFLFEAYIETVMNKPQSTDDAVNKRNTAYKDVADAVNKRNMAYKDVADSSLPIRWTTRRRDLFLLETIHRNWSSDRWRKNIEERMKLLVLHYRSLEDERRRKEDDRRHDENERREDSTRKLSRIAVFLTAVTVVSAIADLINLWADNKEGTSSLKKIGFYISLASVLLVVGGLFWFLREKPKPSSEGNDDQQPKAVHSTAAATEKPQ